MSGANPSYGLQAKFEATDVGRSVQTVFGHPTVQGRGSITIDLTATGNTGESLLRSLDGKLCVTLLEGGRVGLDINTLIAAEKEPLPAGTWQDVSARAISVDKLDARFIVTGGIIRTQSAEAVSGERALRADGAISLLDRRLDVQLAVGDVAKPVPEGAEVSQMKLHPREVINVKGPWSAPAVHSAPTDDSRKYGPPSPG
jgi:uncharacterized protein involved in outer membrane biogenesis